MFGSLADNRLCGVYGERESTGGYVTRGTYTTEGINALFEGLKGSSVTSLKCAAPATDGRPSSVSSP